MDNCTGFMLFTVLHTFSSSLCALPSTRRYLSIKIAWEWRWRKGAEETQAGRKGQRKKEKSKGNVIPEGF